jgi:hypothetical protein
MNISAQSVTKNLNVSSLRVMSPCPALRAMMNALNGLCPPAVLRAAVIIHHRPAPQRVQAAQARTAVRVIEKLFLDGCNISTKWVERCSASALDMIPTVLWRDVP